MGKLQYKAGKKYTFSDYFEFNNPADEIANEFGYTFETKALEFAAGKIINPEKIATLKNQFYQILPNINLNSEMAKREFMIAPVLWGVMGYINAKIRVEYPIEINDKLGGQLDYLIKSQQELIVIEAKKGDLDKGFNQLIVQMIGLEQDESHVKKSEFIYGAVSIGELWRFGRLNRKKKFIQRDLHTYRIPEDIEKIFSILIGILQN